MLSPPPLGLRQVLLTLAVPLVPLGSGLGSWSCNMEGSSSMFWELRLRPNMGEVHLDRMLHPAQPACYIQPRRFRKRQWALCSYPLLAEAR